MSPARTFRTGCFTPTIITGASSADGGTNLRAVADIGTHWMDLAQFLIGAADPCRLRRSGHVSSPPIQAARADRHLRRPERDAPVVRRPQEVEITTDDHAAVLLRFEGGARGPFHVSQVTAGRKNRLTIEIAATGGAAFWDSESPNQPLAGLAQEAQPGSGTRPGSARAGRRRDQPLSGRACRRISRHVQAAFP